MAQLVDEKILVTGPAGQIAFPLAARLARDNEIWGIARFRDAAGRERVEKAGIQTRSIDLADPDWGDLPDDFTLVLHLAAAIVPGHDYDRSIRINAEGTGRVMARHHRARACLVMSTCGVYLSPEDGERAIVETDPLGGSHQPYSPTYCVSKIAQEAVARFSAEAYGLPTTIARMNVAYGDNGGLPAMMAAAILAGHPMPTLPGHSVCSPIHEDDIFDHTPGLIAAASVPATITNWGGDEAVDLREMNALPRHAAGTRRDDEGVRRRHPPVPPRPDPPHRAGGPLQGRLEGRGAAHGRRAPPRDRAPRRLGRVELEAGQISLSAPVAQQLEEGGRAAAEVPAEPARPLSGLALVVVVAGGAALWKPPRCCRGISWIVRTHSPRPRRTPRPCSHRRSRSLRLTTYAMCWLCSL